MGLPVQWCALVYADALYRLTHDSIGYWKQLADGITVSGIRAELLKGIRCDATGLLPDFFRCEAR